jgi:hypothetical protein
MYIRKILFAVLFLIVGTVSAGVKIENWITADGAKVYFVENHNLPMIDISVSFKAGSARDSLKNSGTASFTNHLMLLGSGGIDEVSLANQFTDIVASEHFQKKKILLLSCSTKSYTNRILMKTLSPEKRRGIMRVFAKAKQNHPALHQKLL